VFFWRSYSGKGLEQCESRNISIVKRPTGGRFCRFIDVRYGSKADIQIGV